MAKQSEQILEEQLVANLQKLGYQFVTVPDEKGHCYKNYLVKTVNK